jgi:hypothetical protein
MIVMKYFTAQSEARPRQSFGNAEWFKPKAPVKRSGMSNFMISNPLRTISHSRFPKLSVLALTLALGCVLVCQIQAAPVEAEGRAAGDLPNAREIALADALREAVRQGTGVDVLGSTGTSNFTLDFDRVLGSAFGHVKSYKILDSRLGSDGIYRVRISAEVEKGSPHAKNSLAMRELLFRKNSPRLSVLIDGPAGRQASLLLEEAARDLQIQTVPPGAPCDFQILGDLSLRSTGRQTLNGSAPQNMFAARGALRAIRADTGDIVVSDSLASLREIGSPLLEIPDAENDALERALRHEQTDGVPSILGKIIARWVTETDLGSVKRLEFSGITADDFQKIRSHLSEANKISAVWSREYDSRGISVLDVETRLDNMGLGQEITKATGGRTKLNRSTENLLAFNANGAGTAAQGDAKSEEKKWYQFWD